MDIFITKQGLKILVSLFGAGFIFGLLTGIIGFSLAVDAMAGR